MSDKQVSLTIDGVPVSVPEGTLVIRAAEQLGLYIPRFCDHPYLQPLGACRQCMIEVEGQRKPLTSCTTTCTEGMVVKTQFSSEIARSAQEGVLELLLINHPLDCPMCDKGGECPLQDQVLAYGPGASRMIDRKRRYAKPVPVNELVYLDRERCVLCARCTRFASEISGDPFIELFERGALEQVAIFEDDPYRSNFSGNVIQICPVGALTSKEFRFRARPFDMSSFGSTCTQCASGCSITIQERKNQIVRVLARDDAEVNDVWSCDKGRFAHGYVGSPDRIAEPMLRKNGELAGVSWAEALERVAESITVAKAEGSKIGVLTGGNLLDEDVFALGRFARTVLETNDIDLSLGIPWPEGFIDAWLSCEPATNASIDAASTIVVAGIDLYEESPIVFLRVRKAAMRGARVIEIGPRATELPGEKVLVPIGGVAAAIDDVRASDGATVVLAGERLAASPGALESVWNAAAGAGASFGFITRKAGVRSALAAGFRSTPGSRDAQAMLSQPGLLLLVGSDPAADFASATKFDPARGPAIVAIDLFATESVRSADIVLPACSPIERDGTITNWEGRTRPVRRAIEPVGQSAPDWEILARIAHQLRVEFPRSVDQLTAMIPQPARSPMGTIGSPPAATASSRSDGSAEGFERVTYRLLIDQGTLMAAATDLQASMLSSFVEMSEADAASSGLHDGDIVAVSASGWKAELPLRVSRKLAQGCVFIPSDQPGLSLNTTSADASRVRVVKR